MNRTMVLYCLFGYSCKSSTAQLCLLKWYDAAFVYSEIAVNAKRLFMRYVFRNSSMLCRLCTKHKKYYGFELYALK